MPKPSRRFAIETRYVGKSLAPWEGWKVTRIFGTAEDRDEHLKWLQSMNLANWEYRVRVSGGAGS
jgi:hypothetical protein